MGKILLVKEWKVKFKYGMFSFQNQSVYLPNTILENNIPVSLGTHLSFPGHDYIHEVCTLNEPSHKKFETHYQCMSQSTYDGPHFLLVQTSGLDLNDIEPQLFIVITNLKKKYKIQKSDWFLDMRLYLQVIPGVV